MKLIITYFGPATIGGGDSSIIEELVKNRPQKRKTEPKTAGNAARKRYGPPLLYPRKGKTGCEDERNGAGLEPTERN
jgi:hypothetical protein